MAEKITNTELRALVDNEIREAMGEISGELADERSRSLDYYHGEPTGKLAVPSSDRSSAVLTTVRDTVEWILPEMMRVLAKADKIVEFEPVGQEDEEAAEQETEAINHIFWRQNSGFLILYSWIKDALLQKNGVVKWWLDESETRSREEYDGVTQFKLQELQDDPEMEAIEHEPSDVESVDGMPLHHVVYERKKKRQRICVEVVPPEEFLISSDCRTINIAEGKPRFCGHYTEKTRTELKEMGFDDDVVEKMARGGGEFIEEWDEEYYARYRLTDEQQHMGRNEPHESQKKIRLVEGYMRLDEDGDGYAELIQIWRAGDYCESEPCDQIPFAALTPNILTHKFYGMSVADMVADLQEIGTSVLRNVLDNMYQTNNARPVVNNRVDLDSLLQSRPGAPIYVDDEQGVQDAVMPFAPPPMWKDGLEFLAWQDGARKDRTGVGDEVMGLDPHTLSNANTGVVAQAFEAARAKIELIARIFAETGIRWLFQGLHEAARKSYDQPLRYRLRREYVEVKPQEWRERTDMSVNVGTATGSEIRELGALAKVAELQQGMLQAGGLGLTVIPSNIHKMAIDTIECMGKKDAEKYFFDPMLRANPEVMQQVQAQMPQQQGDPNEGMIAAQVQIEQGKAQVDMQKAQMQAQLKQAELMLKREELGIKSELEQMKQGMQALTNQAKQESASEKIAVDALNDRMNTNIKAIEVALDARQEQQQAAIDQYRAELQSYTNLETKRMDIVAAESQSVIDVARRAEERAVISSQKAEMSSDKIVGTEQILEKAFAEITSVLAAMRADMSKPKKIERDGDGQIISVGQQPVMYSDDGTIDGVG